MTDSPEPVAPSRGRPLLEWVANNQGKTLLLLVAVVIAVVWVAWDLTGPHAEDAKSACHSAVKAELPEPDLAVWGFNEQVDSFNAGWDVRGTVSEQGHDWAFSCTVSKDGSVLSHYVTSR